MISEMCSALVAEHFDPDAAAPVLVAGRSLPLEACGAVAPLARGVRQ